MSGFVNGPQFRKSYDDTQEALKYISKPYACRVDDASATVTYVGKAALGTLDSAASWQIQKLTVSGNVLLITYADGDGLFDNIWNNRASLTYI